MSIIVLKNKKTTILNILRTMKVLQNIAQINFKKNIEYKSNSLFELLKNHNQINATYKNFEIELNILIGYDQGMTGNCLNIIKNFIHTSGLKFKLIGKKIAGVGLPKNEEQIIAICKNFLNNYKKNTSIKVAIYYLSKKEMHKTEFSLNLAHYNFSLFYFAKQLHYALVNSACEENIQRLIATENAKNSAEKMIKTLDIKINKVRQGKITSEMLELLQ